MSEQPTSDKMFGEYRLVSATPIGKPTLATNVRGRKVVLEAFDEVTDTQMLGMKRGRLDDGFQPYGNNKRMRLMPPPPIVPPPHVIPPPPPPPPVRSVGVYDIGQGNCNLLLDQNLEPVVYYDIGYPLWFFLNSVPATMRVGNPAFMGPILNNTAGTLEVILSHWDYDHWRMGGYAAMNNLNWTVPVQPVGPTALAFWNSIPGANQFLYPPATPFIPFVHYVMLDCQPTPGMAAPAIINNTGIALWMDIRLPTTDVTTHKLLLTGDANCDCVYALHPNFGAMTGLLAVHHGSNAHGAPANLPAQAAGYAGAGRVVYSYGVSSVTGGHAYGFPNALAVAAYRAAGWGIAAAPANIDECGTAEGFHINGGAGPGVLAHRGNIRVADNSPLPVAYNYSAFSAIQHQVN